MILRSAVLYCFGGELVLSLLKIASRIFWYSSGVEVRPTFFSWRYLAKIWREKISVSERLASGSAVLEPVWLAAGFAARGVWLFLTSFPSETPSLSVSGSLASVFQRISSQSKRPSLSESGGRSEEHTSELH